MNTLYVLFYDEDNGSRESWSVFYCPCEIFDTKQKRAEREAEIRDINPDLEFHYEDIKLNEKLEIDVWDDDEEE